MNKQINFTREDIAESLHIDFGLTKKDCIIFVNDIIDIIIEGLNTDDKIVKEGLARLADGMVVRPILK